MMMPRWRRHRGSAEWERVSSSPTD